MRVDGRGLVVTDGVRKVKASEIGRAVSRVRLERRLGPLGEYRTRQTVAARTLDERTPRVDRAHSGRNPADLSGGFTTSLTCRRCKTLWR